LTHGGHSNNPPRKEAYNVFELLKNSISIDKVSVNIQKWDRIYISRRTWTQEKTDNIGTDYTTRRKMVNEDDLVRKLVNLGFVEIFAENLNMDEKLYVFSHAKIIVGAIGGGMVNLLFSSPSTQSFVIVSPHFLQVNQRFRYCMENTNIQYINDVEHTPYHEIPLYTRVKVIDKQSKYYGLYGELCSYLGETNKFCINLSGNDVAGFNNECDYLQECFTKEQIEALDNGLNSPFTVSIDAITNKLLIK